MVLETAFILHFAPSEIVIPYAAHHLVSNRADFGFLLVVTTVGALSVGGGWWIWTQRETVRKRFGY